MVILFQSVVATKCNICCARELYIVQVNAAEAQANQNLAVQHTLREVLGEDAVQWSQRLEALEQGLTRVEVTTTASLTTLCALAPTVLIMSCLFSVLMLCAQELQKRMQMAEQIIHRLALEVYGSNSAALASCAKGLAALAQSPSLHVIVT